jgi:hypothetical protein
MRLLDSAVEARFTGGTPAGDKKDMQGEEARRRHAGADRLIRAMYLDRVGWGARERARELKLGAVFATVRGDAGGSAALHRLIYGLQERSRLVAVEPVMGSLGPQAGNTGLDALLHLARLHAAWRREPEALVGFQAAPRSPSPQLAPTETPSHRAGLERGEGGHEGVWHAGQTPPTWPIDTGNERRAGRHDPKRKLARSMISSP